MWVHINAPNYLSLHFSGRCITSGLAGCIFSSDPPLALPHCLLVDRVTTLLLKESGRCRLELSHSATTHGNVAQAGTKQEKGHSHMFLVSDNEEVEMFTATGSGSTSSWLTTDIRYTRSVSMEHGLWRIPERPILMQALLCIAPRHQKLQGCKRKNYERSYENTPRSTFLFSCPCSLSLF